MVEFVNEINNSINAIPIIILFFLANISLQYLFNQLCTFPFVEWLSSALPTAEKHTSSTAISTMLPKKPTQLLLKGMTAAKASYPTTAVTSDKSSTMFQEPHHIGNMPSSA